MPSLNTSETLGGYKDSGACNEANQTQWRRTSGCRRDCSRRVGDGVLVAGRGSAGLSEPPHHSKSVPDHDGLTDSNQGSVSISVEQLKHAGVVAKPPRQSPAITKSQALDLAEQYAGGDLETAETATLYRVTTTGHGRLGSDGEIDPTWEDQLTWIVLVTGGLPVDIEPVRPTPHHSPREQEPTGPAGFLIVLINAESGHVMYGFSR
jgi:cobalamin biosynthesis Mg chelatase CobN